MAAPRSYSFRPRKQIQRHLIAEICRGLTPIAPTEDFEYVGFGGYEFIDFDLFRRKLGITRMVSYEEQIDEARFRFNLPFGGVDLRFGPASQHLPFLDRATLRIVWLDYARRLNTEVIQDLQAAAARLAPGSLLIVSVNSHPAQPRATRRLQLVEDVAEDRIPNGVDDDTLGKWGLADVQRAILLDAINESLSRRDDGATFEQIIHFRYADGAQMMTVGGIVVTMDLCRAFAACHFEDMAYVSRDDNPIQISVPALTMREALHLNRQMLATPDTELACPGLESEAAAAYARFYRWYPPIPTPI